MATREAMASAYRLPLDARSVGAISVIAELVAAPLSAHHASWLITPVPSIRPMHLGTSYKERR
jgi:hypothetical protein